MPVLVACCFTACASQQTEEIRPTTALPDGCSQIGNRWKLKVKECDNVEFKVSAGGRNRSAMIAFDKDSAFKSPGKRPAYLTRNGKIVVPVDNRTGSGDDPFAYSIHVDCTANTECPPLDPMIIVER